MENSFDGKVIWEDGGIVPMTTKQSDLPDILMEHGIGLKKCKECGRPLSWRYGYQNKKRCV